MMDDSWTTEDKRRLLFLLYQHGPLDLKLLQQKLPHKSVEEIQYICNKHMELAERKRDEEDDYNGLSEEAKNKKKQRPALKVWSNVLKNINNNQKEPITDLIPRVLKYIALFEKRENSPALKINLSACYQMLSDMCNGLEGGRLSTADGHFLRECLNRLSEEAIAPGTHGLQKILRTMERVIEPSEKIRKTVNPLCLSKDILKLATFEKTDNLFE